MPADYLSSYLSLSGDSGLDGPSGRYTIPPLVGRIEVAAYEVWDGGEDGPYREWKNDGRYVHFCDRLDKIFPDYQSVSDKTNECEEVDPKENLRVERWLSIDYRMASVPGHWLEKMNNFPYWPGAMQPTDHWVLRKKEVDQPMSLRIVSQFLPEPLAHSLNLKLPGVWQTILRATREIGNARCRVLPPIWFDYGFLNACLKFAKERSGLFKTHRIISGKRIRMSNVDYMSFQSFDDPSRVRFDHAIKWLNDRNTDEPNKPSSLDFNETFSTWKEAWFFVAELAEVKRQDVWEQQQKLFELHREICASLETVIRRRFAEENFRTRASGFGLEFREWIESSWNICSLDYWDQKLYNEAFEPVLRSNLNSNIRTLDELIDSILGRVSDLQTPVGKGGLALAVRMLLDVEIPHSDPKLPSWIDAAEVLKHNIALGDLLVAAKLLIDFRNLLTHGTVDENQPNDHEVIVVNHEMEFCVRLTERSLEYFLRLLVPLLEAFHEKPYIKSLAFDWLKSYKLMKPDVKLNSFPRIHHKDYGPVDEVRLWFEESSKYGRKRRRQDSPELRVLVLGSRVGFIVQNYKKQWDSEKVDELVLLFVKEQECLWLERGSREREKIVSEEVLQSRFFQGLQLDVAAFFSKDHA